MIYPHLKMTKKVKNNRKEQIKDDKPDNGGGFSKPQEISEKLCNFLGKSQGSIWYHVSSVYSRQLSLLGWEPVYLTSCIVFDYFPNHISFFFSISYKTNYIIKINYHILCFI